MSNYEAAPSTQMLASHCAVCSRPLRDVISVEIGMGPDCREKHGYAELDLATPDAQAEGNKIVHAIAVTRRQDPETLAQGLARLRALGFTRLAERIEFRGKDAPAPEIITILVEEYTLPAATFNGRTYPAKSGYLVTTPYVETAVEAWRRIPGRVFVREAKANFVPATSVAELRALLRAHYAGATCVGPNGTTVIGAPAQAAA